MLISKRFILRRSSGIFSNSEWFQRVPPAFSVASAFSHFLTSHTMDLTHIGKHCHLEDCRKLDFLPFRCGHCKHNFCVEHRLPEKHECQHYTPPRAPVVAVCQDCKRSIVQKGNETLPELFKRHFESGECKKFKVEKPHRCTFIKPSGKQCKRREFDEIICKFCNQNYCIKHRHAEHHKCPGLERKKRDLEKRSDQRVKREKERKSNPQACATEARKERPKRASNLAHSRLVKMFDKR
ncbi:hypothetical protein AAMO2058_001543900 [Amorphochlora amoebiformis]